MTTGRINQVAFLRDVGTAWRSGRPRRGASVVRVEGRNAWHRTNGAETPRPGNVPHPRARPSTCAPMQPHRIRGHARDTGRGVWSAPWPLGARDGRGTALASDFRRLRYAAQDLGFAPRALGRVGEGLKRAAVRQFDAGRHGACPQARPKHHSCAHCVRAAESTHTVQRPASRENPTDEQRRRWARPRCNR